MNKKKINIRCPINIIKFEYVHDFFSIPTIRQSHDDHPRKKLPALGGEKNQTNAKSQRLVPATAKWNHTTKETTKWNGNSWPISLSVGGHHTRNSCHIAH